MANHKGTHQYRIPWLNGVLVVSCHVHVRQWIKKPFFSECVMTTINSRENCQNIERDQRMDVNASTCSSTHPPLKHVIDVITTRVKDDQSKGRCHSKQSPQTQLNCRIVRCVSTRAFLTRCAHLVFHTPDEDDGPAFAQQPIAYHSHILLPMSLH